MDYNKKISITVNSVDVLQDDKKLISGEYINDLDELVLISFTVGKRFNIKKNHILKGEFKKFSEVDYPLPIALGVVQNDEVHKTPFQCMLQETVIAGKKVEYFTEEDLDLLG